jgi:branched-chain amino acid transport system substrate-binding protein
MRGQTDSADLRQGMRLLSCAVIAAMVVTMPMPAKADDPVSLKIGVLTDMNGPYGDAAGEGSVVAAKLAVEDFGPSVLGRPIEIVAADHQNRPDVASDIARRWFDRDGVEMVTDLTNSGVAIAVQAVAREKHRIDLVTSTASTALTNKECSPYGAHWTFDSYALSAGTAGAVVAEGGKSWFFVTADYAFGANLEATARQRIESAGGTVLGHALAPLNTSDFSSELLAAQASGATVIGLANSGADTANSVKQAFEFGLGGTHTLAAFLPFLTDIHAMGLNTVQGLILTTAFYWDRTDETRAWARHFFAAHQAMPTMIHAGTYSAVLHYLRSVQDAGSTEAGAVMRAMRRRPVHDVVFADGHVRGDGQMVHDMYLARVKQPSASHGPWDLYDIVRTIPGKDAFAPLAQSTCPFVVGSE